MIALENVSKSFGKFEALHSIDMKIENGIYGLIGPNGAGKTTLMRCLIGIYEINKGNILIDSQNMKKIKNLEREIGYLPQKFGFYKELTVYETLEYICSLKGVAKKDYTSEIEKRIKQVNLSEKEHTKVGALSGGMLRRLGIAQALIAEPKIIIVDEPTAGLDPEERARFKSIIRGLSKDKIVIISTHILEDVEALCDKIIVMNKGNILEIGSIEGIASIADNMIYETDKDLPEGGHEVKIVEKDGEIFTRYIDYQEKKEGIPMVATLEDGYTFLLNKNRE